MSLFEGGQHRLQEIDRILSDLSKAYKTVLVFLIWMLVFSLDHLTGPRVTFSIFYIINLYVSIKYLDRRYSYLLILLIVFGRLYIKLHDVIGLWHWGYWTWQFINNSFIYLLFFYLMDYQLSARRHAEAALDDQLRLNEAIIKKTDAGILMFDEQGKCVIANSSVARMLGRPLDALQKCELGRDEAIFTPVLLNEINSTLQGCGQHQFTLKLGQEDQPVWSQVSIGRIERENASYLLLVFADISAYKLVQDTAAKAIKRARLAEHNMVNIGEEVQRRIGRELHDDLGQHLAGMAFLSEVLFRNLQDAGYEHRQDASRITALVNEAVNKTRYLAQGLYPEELKEKGLCEMMAKLASFVEVTRQIDCEFTCEKQSNIGDPDIAIHLFRIAQEAVNNAARHGAAKHIYLHLTLVNNVRILVIDDDGCGFGNATGSRKGGGLGMRTMQYRADLIGANLKVCPSPSGGTRIVVTLPIELQE